MYKGLDKILSDFRFPVFALGLLLSSSVFFAAMIFVPPGHDALAVFAEEFRVWCFGYDPATGSYPWGYVATMFGQPLLLAVIVLGIWGGALKEARARPWIAGKYLAASLGLVLLTALSVGLFAPPAPRGELPFPADDLRTAMPPPTFELIDHRNEAVSLEKLRGRVVMITGVYASCGFTCPTIMAQSRQVVRDLPEKLQRELSVIAITLDPERDSVQRLAQLATVQELDTPVFHLATGDEKHVNRTLDLLGFSRKRDPKTGVIDHSNLFILLDREGKIVYRFSLGDQQRRWLEQAIRLLLAEAPLS